jgi:hypothetical protein
MCYVLCVMCYVNTNYIVTSVTYNNKINKEISKKDKGKQIIFSFFFFFFFFKKKTVTEGFEHSSGVQSCKGGNQALENLEISSGQPLIFPGSNQCPHL